VTKDGPVEVFIGSQVVAKRLLHLNLRAPLVNPPRGGLPGAGRAPPSFDLDSTRSVSRLFRRSNVTRSINPQDAQPQVATGRHAARASSRGIPREAGDGSLRTRTWARAPRTSRLEVVAPSCRTPFHAGAVEVRRFSTLACALPDPSSDQQRSVLECDAIAHLQP
jgi:hypothetical protein